MTLRGMRMTLLISKAAPSLRWRFATDRHNFATGQNARERSRMRRWYRVRAKERQRAGLPRIIAIFRIAEGLGSHWRFFATYAGV